MQGNIIEAETSMILTKIMLRFKKTCNKYRPAKVKNLQYLGGTLLGNTAAEAQTSDVGKTKSAFWRRGQSFTSSSCQHTDMRLSAQHHLALTRLVWITLFHSLFHSFVPFPLCSAYYHHTVRREWFKTYAFQFKKLMLGLGRSLFSHLWPSGGSAQRLKKQVSSPLSSLMLCFADNKLKWKADSEINITEQRIPGKTCMTDKVSNMPDGQYRQGAFFPVRRRLITLERRGRNQPRKVTDQMMTRHISISLLRVQSHALLLHDTGTVPLWFLGYHIWLEHVDVGYQVEPSMTDVEFGQFPRHSKNKKWPSSPISSTTSSLKHFTVFQKCGKVWSYFLLLC